MSEVVRVRIGDGEMGMTSLNVSEVVNECEWSDDV